MNILKLNFIFIFLAFPICSFASTEFTNLTPEEVYKHCEAILAPVSGDTAEQRILARTARIPKYVQLFDDIHERRLAGRDFSQGYELQSYLLAKLLVRYEGTSEVDFLPKYLDQYISNVLPDKTILPAWDLLRRAYFGLQRTYVPVSVETVLICHLWFKWTHVTRRANVGRFILGVLKRVKRKPQSELNKQTLSKIESEIVMYIDSQEITRLSQLSKSQLMTEALALGLDSSEQLFSDLAEINE